MSAPQDIVAWVAGRRRVMDKIEVHRRGLRHPAVSVFVRSGPRFLFQQRAATKYHSALQWANTCCTHPFPGETPLACARRRLGEELGLAPPELRPIGRVEYRAEVGGGLVEHERVDVFLGEVAGEPPLAPDPAEVAATAWMTLEAALAAVAAAPQSFTPWLRLYLTTHRPALFGRG